MSEAESTEGRNTQKLRTFHIEDFELGNATKKWSHVKVVVNQEHSTDAEYGIKFIRFNTEEQKVV